MKARFDLHWIAYVASTILVLVHVSLGQSADVPLATQPSTWTPKQFHFIHYDAFGGPKPYYGMHPDLLIDVKLPDGSKLFLEYSGSHFDFEKKSKGERVLRSFGFAESRRYADPESPMHDYGGCSLDFPRSFIRDGDIIAAVGRVWRIKFERSRMGGYDQLTFERVQESELPEGVAYPGINHALLEGGTATLSGHSRIELRKVVGKTSANDSASKNKHLANVVVFDRIDHPIPVPGKAEPISAIGIGDIIVVPDPQRTYRMRVQAIVPSMPEKRMIGWIALEPLPPLPAQKRAKNST